MCVTPFFKSKQMVTCSILLDGAEEFFCSFVYAANGVQERKELWSDIKNHRDLLIVFKQPWLVFGDFNKILDMKSIQITKSRQLSLQGCMTFRALLITVPCWICLIKDQSLRGETNNLAG